MKKFLLALTVIGFAYADPISIYSNAQPVKPVQEVTQPYTGYWNAYFKPIQLCIKEAYKTETEHSNLPRNEYIKDLGLGSGYYVLVNTKNYEISDICLLQYELQKKGYRPIYEEPIDTLIVGIFQRKPDAEGIANELKAAKDDVEVKYIVSENRQLSYVKEQPTTNISNGVSQQDFNDAIKIINKQFKKQNEINQELYRKVLELQQEINAMRQPSTTNTGETLKTANIVSGANVRTCPGTQCSVVKTLQKGDKVYFLGYEGDWAKVKLSENGNTYYIYKHLLEVK